jgi:hypothetical protein
MNGKTVGFFDKDSSKAYEQVKDELYARLKMNDDIIAEYNNDEIALDSVAVREYLFCLNDEQTFLRNLIDKMERS